MTLKTKVRRSEGLYLINNGEGVEIGHITLYTILNSGYVMEDPTVTLDLTLDI